MKRILCFMLAVLMLAGLLTGCSDELKIFTDVDFASSPFKHLNNGGITDSDTLPYNVDAITGATLTVEGPGVVTSTPLSVRELESRSDGLESFRTRFDDIVGDDVTVDDTCPQFAQHGDDSAFAGGNAAGQANM